MCEVDTRQIRSFFDERAKHWDAVDNHEETKIARLLSEVGIRENDKVLDLGCGTGVISLMLYEKTHRQIDAVDLSEKMILEAKKKGISDKKVSFRCADFYSMENGDFDEIIIFDAYPHFLQLQAFKEALLRNLSDQGKFAIIHDLGRKQLHDCHKGRDVSLLSRDLFDPRKEAEFYQDSFTILKAEEGEDYYLLIGEKNTMEPSFYSLSEEGDKRRKKTRELLIQVFYSLLKEKDYQEITAVDVIRASKVSSSTFYSHFKGKEDIVKAIVDSILEHVLAEKNRKEINHDFSKIKNPSSLLTHLFLHLKEDKDSLLLLFSNIEGKHVFFEKMKEGLVPLMNSFLDCRIIDKEGLDQRFLSLFLSEALTSYLILWLEEETGCDAEEAAKGFLGLFHAF